MVGLSLKGKRYSPIGAELGSEMAAFTLEDILLWTLLFFIVRRMHGKFYNDNIHVESPGVVKHLQVSF